MPIDAILVCAAVVSMFLVFGAVVVWGDLQTRSPRGVAAAHPQKRRGN